MSLIDTAPQSATVTATPEFADAKTAQRLFGLSRSYLYALASQKAIQSISVRKRGNVRGRRLFVCDTIRAFIRSHDH